MRSHPDMQLPSITRRHWLAQAGLGFGAWARYALLTGQARVGWPSVGAWVTYGLGCEADNLPALVVMTDPDGKVKGGTPLWSNGFLPPLYQGATLQTEGTPILYLDRPDGVTEAAQRETLDLAQRLNRRHRERT